MAASPRASRRGSLALAGSTIALGLLLGPLSGFELGRGGSVAVPLFGPDAIWGFGAAAFALAIATTRRLGSIHVALLVHALAAPLLRSWLVTFAEPGSVLFGTDAVPAAFLFTVLAFAGPGKERAA